MANYPTPQNIVSITYQLLQQINDPASVRGQLPALTIQFIDDNSVTRNKVVTFREMLPYLRYLHDKAVSLGQFVVCDPESTFDKKIVLTIGTPASGFIQMVQLALAPTYVCTQFPTIVYLDHAAPFVPGDTLYTDNTLSTPITGFDLVCNMDTGEVFDLDPVTGVVGAITVTTCTFPPASIPPFNVTFQLNGVDFTPTESLSGGANTSPIDDKSLTVTGIIPLVNFILPRLGGEKLLDDYNFPFTLAGLYYGTNAGANWNVNAYFQFPSAVPVTINVTTNTNFVTVQNINNIAGQSLEVGIWTDTFDRVYSLGYVGAPNDKIRLPKAGVAMNPQAYSSSSIAGVWEVRQYDINGVEIGFTDNAYSTQNIPFIVGAALITFKFKRLNFINNIVGSANKITISDFSVSGYGFALIYDESNTSQYLRYPKGLPSNIIGVHTNDAALLPYNISFYKNGVLIDTTAVITQEQAVVTADASWDTLVFGTATPPPTGNLTIENQMGVAPQETTQIDDVSVGGSTVVVVPAYPVLPLQNSSGTFTGGAATIVDCTISNTGVITPTTVRLIDALGVNHDLPYAADGVYNWGAVNTLGLIRVILF
jgi:hypothetical protein